MDYNENVKQTMPPPQEIIKHPTSSTSLDYPQSYPTSGSGFPNHALVPPSPLYSSRSSLSSNGSPHFAEAPNSADHFDSRFAFLFKFIFKDSFFRGSYRIQFLASHMVLITA